MTRRKASDPPRPRGRPPGSGLSPDPQVSITFPVPRSVRDQVRALEPRGEERLELCRRVEAAVRAYLQERRGVS